MLKKILKTNKKGIIIFILIFSSMEGGSNSWLGPLYDTEPTSTFLIIGDE